MEPVALLVTLCWLAGLTVSLLAYSFGAHHGARTADRVLTLAVAAVSGLAPSEAAPTALQARPAPWSTYRAIPLAELRALRAALPIPVVEKPFVLPSPNEARTVVDRKPVAPAQDDLLVASPMGWSTGKWPASAIAFSQHDYMSEVV